MTTRTIDEIQADARHATRINDADALMNLATELDALHTPLADASASGSRGVAFSLRGDYPEALSQFHRALALCEELVDRSGVARVTGNIGIVYQNTGNFPEALTHYHRALALHEELGDRRNVAGVTTNIGSLYYYTGDYPEALRYHHRALALQEELGDRSGVARVTGNIGTVHDSTGDYTEALSHYYRALALHEELGDRHNVAGVTGNILASYVEMGSDTEAQQLLATMDAMHIDDPGTRIYREQNRAKLQERRGDLDAAAATLQEALNQSREHGLRSQAANMHKALRDLSQIRNDLAGYIDHNNEFARISEEVNGKETATKLAMQAKQREIDAKDRETEKHMAVLHSTLPKHIADRVARGETVNDHYDNATVIFLDIVDFTTISDRIPSGHVVHLLEQIFSTLDAVCEKHNVVKIKTIGDSYMAVAFPLESSSCEQRAARTALEMLQAVSHIVYPASSPEGSPASSPLQVRIGLHCGPVTAGVIGKQRMQYDVWGDTVNVASRMESTSEPGRIHVSSSFALALQGEMAKVRSGETDVIPSVSEEPGTWHLAPRGTLEIKGKGMMTTFWLE